MDRRIIKTKEAIRKAYFDLMREKDGNRISVSEIARRANIDRKTFYLHYESVDDILKELCTEKVQELKDRLAQTGFYEEPLHLDYLLICIYQMLEADMALYQRLAMNPNCALFWDEIYKLAEETLISVYAPKVSISKEELTIYAKFFCSGILTLYLEALSGKEEIDLELAGKAIVKIAQHGVMDIFGKES